MSDIRGFGRLDVVQQFFGVLKMGVWNEGSRSLRNMGNVRNNCNLSVLL
jgi:hypothetical protein